MSYELHTDVQSANFYTPAQCLSHYGISRSIGGITIHHWGSPNTGLQWDSIRRYLSRTNGNTSAHLVAEAGRVARIVSDVNAAWHAGSGVGNARTIGIEMRPEGSDEDYETVAELIKDLWDEHGVVPLYRHDHWSATSCPGDIDINRLNSMAVDLRNFGGGTTPTPVNNPVPAPTTAPTPAPSTLGYAMDRLDLRNAQNVPVRGRHVDNLEGLLLAAGYGPQGLVDPKTGRPDGVAGPAVKAYVAAAQVKFNTGDGNGHADYIVGDGTWKALIEY